MGKLLNRGTFALVGAFLIELTIGTIYTLGNTNSYLASYQRKHGFPEITYEQGIWIHCASLMGQGVAMIAGGYLAKVISIRYTCFFGCILHSSSVIATAWTLQFGFFGPLISLGLLTGLGAGVVYLNLLANVLGWFPNRRGLVGGLVMSGFGLGTFIFNTAQTSYVNLNNLSPLKEDDGYFTQTEILDRVPGLFIFFGCLYASLQFIGCCLQFKPPTVEKLPSNDASLSKDIEVPFTKSIRTREFIVLFISYVIPSPVVVFLNTMLKEYGLLFIRDDLFLAMVASLGSVSNGLNRILWGIGYDAFGFGLCYTCINTLYIVLLILAPFEFILTSKLWYLLCALGLLGLFGGWKTNYPVHLACLFGNANTTMNFGVMLLTQSIIGIGLGYVANYFTQHYSRFVIFYFLAILQLLGIIIYHLFYPTKR